MTRRDSPRPPGEGQGEALEVGQRTAPFFGLLAALTTTACSGPQRALAPQGPAAQELTWLTFALFVGVGVPTLVVFALWAYGLWRGVARGRSRSAEPAPASPPSPTEERALAVGAVVVLAILVVLLALSVRTGGRVLAAPTDADVEIEVVAHQFWWEVRYPRHGVVTANELVIPAGEKVALSLATADVIHSFWVPELHGKRDMTPGHVKPFWLQADRPGRYRGQCAEFCGMQHALMAFWVRAVPRAEYEAWLSSQRAPALEEPRAGASHAQGRATFTEGGCHLCHTVRGLHPSGAAQRPGPDLTHFATRSHFAAATAEVTKENLKRFITDPHVLKPGARMPPTAVPDDALDALVDWLLALE